MTTPPCAISDLAALAVVTIADVSDGRFKARRESNAMVKLCPLGPRARDGWIARQTHDRVWLSNACKVADANVPPLEN